MKGNGATPLTTQDLFYRDELSIPTARTNHPICLEQLSNFARQQKANTKKIGNPDAMTIATELIVPLGFCLKRIQDRNAEMAEIAFVPSGDGEAVNACRRRYHGVFCQHIRTTVHQARIFAKAR